MRHIFKMFLPRNPDAGSDSASLLRLKQLGSASSDKALAVNLDPNFYGSFAEIGAGQEVSRTFLTAGAAAGTVARSMSAYDMQMSDAMYGQAARYVTYERLRQMLDTEYDILDKSIREVKGEDCQIFAFADTVAARAYMSNRECDGWVGVTYQHAARAEKSSVILHIRMSDPTANQQGEAIGCLGTNLVYLCKELTNPYLITQFLLDGIDIGRIEIDFVEFSGPAFPDVDYRILALRMVQFQTAIAVLLEPDEETGVYKMAVPNTKLYKRPIVVQKSRFQPVTKTHQEVMEAATRKLMAEAGEDTREPIKIMDLQMDEAVRPMELLAANPTLERIQRFESMDSDDDGYLSLKEVIAATDRSKKTREEIEQLFREVDVDGSKLIGIDEVCGVATEGPTVREYLDRFEMLETLKFTVMVSAVPQTHQVAEYLARYSNQQIAVVVGGGGYSIERGLFKSQAYAANDLQGGMLAAFGRLFSEKVRIFEYPNIGEDGSIINPRDNLPAGSAGYLHSYLTGIEKIVPIGRDYVSPAVLDVATNESYRGDSTNVRSLIQAGSSDWQKLVPAEIAAIISERKLYKKTVQEHDPVTAAAMIFQSH